MARTVLHNKLVRDLIPDIIRTKGEKVKTRTLSPAQFRKQLLVKLVEEAHEAAGAQTKQELISECADLQEVMTALYETYKIECSDVTNFARKKRKERGAFKNRTFLVSTSSK